MDRAARLGHLPTVSLGSGMDVAEWLRQIGLERYAELFGELGDPSMRGSAKGWHSPILKRRRRYCVAVEGNYNAMCQNPLGSPYGTCKTRSTKMPGVTT